MFVNVKFACGCERKVNLNGNAKSRERQIKFLEKQNCYRCQENAFDSEAAAWIADNFGELPELAGSEKQVAWARKLRQTICYKIAENGFKILFLVCGSSRLHTVESATPEQCLEALRRLATEQTTARFWIDGREGRFYDAYLETLADVVRSGWEPATEEAEAEATDEATTVDVNAADETALRAIPGIGRVLAARIAAFVRSNGRLESLDELRAVRGIGAKKLDAIKKFAILK